MNELTSLGLILLLALLAGHLVKVVQVPEVTGYILAGGRARPVCARVGIGREPVGVGGSSARLRSA